jgi:transcriptional regulator with XRE-family HTH domain
MEPEHPDVTSEAPPPEARLIRTAREAAGMTAAKAAEATKGAVSATYWRDIERGHGGRRGQQAPARASARLLAAMARVTGVTPDQLAGAQREDAARVLAEILRREDGPHAGASVALSGSGSLTVSELEVLAREAEILFPGDRVKQGIWAFPGDRSKQAIWNTGEPLPTIAEIFDVIDRKRGTVPPPALGESAAAGLSRRRLQSQMQDHEPDTLCTSREHRATHRE